MTDVSVPGPEFHGLLEELYDELRDVARRQLSREGPGHTLQTTALVHEAYLRLRIQRRETWHGRAYLVGAAAGVIRRVLVDHARARRTAKRGAGWQPVSLDGLAMEPGETVDLLALHDALEHLAGLHERQARVVELRFFGGLTVDETATVLGVSERTVASDWRVARAWLRARLAEPEA